MDLEGSLVGSLATNDVATSARPGISHRRPRQTAEPRRNRYSGDGLIRGRALQVPGIAALLVVVADGARVAGEWPATSFSGGRSSGELGFGDAGHRRNHGWS